jgi:hypothetical protein
MHTLLDFAPFVLASALMGLGIAIDVAIATITRFRDASISFRNWTMPITATHILLPAFGYYGWWLLGQEFEGLSTILSLIAFALIATFLYETICAWIGVKPLLSLEPLTRWVFRNSANEAKGRWITILAVSMDALWSGPAKAAQAESGGWTDMQVLLSFFIAGAVVALVAQVSLLAALLLRKARFSDIETLASRMVVGKFLEVSILGGFGVLSAWNALAIWLGLGSLSTSILIASGLMAIVWLTFWKRLMIGQIDEFEAESE